MITIVIGGVASAVKRPSNSGSFDQPPSGPE